MKPLHRACAIAALFAAGATPLATIAQMQTPAPRPGTPAAPGANVQPQLKVPLGRTPPVPASAASGVELSARGASAPGGIDDTVAQCRAQSTRLARQECMDRAGRAAAPR